MHATPRFLDESYFSVVSVDPTERNDGWYVVMWALTGTPGDADFRGEKVDEKGPFKTREDAEQEVRRYRKLNAFW